VRSLTLHDIQSNQQLKETRGGQEPEVTPGTAAVGKLTTAALIMPSGMVVWWLWCLVVVVYKSVEKRVF
jgi:hypothetical protein